jgi:hypothetical protein
MFENLDKEEGVRHVRRHHEGKRETDEEDEVRHITQFTPLIQVHCAFDRLVALSILMHTTGNLNVQY